MRIWSVLAALLCALCLSGCRTYRTVEKVLTDTLIVRDSVYKADTVYQTRVEREIIEREIINEKMQDYRFGDINDIHGFRVDTVYIREVQRVYSSSQQSVIDSLNRVISERMGSQSVRKTAEKVIVEKVVEKSATLWQRILN
ncbi:MAG: hypothetical protein HUK08_08425, partial [Bacteroidaceae bacterium]|nr:hypothetical protein [Bacteroidaceae bacterium]